MAGSFLAAMDLCFDTSRPFFAVDNHCTADSCHRELRYDRYCDAADPLGKTIDAFELVKGWQVQHLLWILLVAVMIVVGTVAVCTPVFRNLQTGLAAGSSAVGIEAFVLGGLTLLSVVLS